MSFNVACPNCKQVLNVTEKAYGKTLPCPGCRQPMVVPNGPPPPQPAAATGHAAAHASGHAAAHAPALPSGMPAVPGDEGTLEFLRAGRPRPAAAPAASPSAPGLNINDMFMGNEKEHVFTLAPGEEKVDELTIDYRHLFFVQAGVTRVTLTTQRLLYTKTRVFSPLYWLALVLFPPLILYYAARISMNRSVAIPLVNLDSVEKRYRANWGLFLLALIVGCFGVELCSMGVAAVLASSSKPPAPNDLAFVMAVQGLLGALMAVGLLVLLLSTRIVGIHVRSLGSNTFFMGVGAAEEAFDAFLQRVHSGMERARQQKG